MELVIKNLNKYFKDKKILTIRLGGDKHEGSGSSDRKAWLTFLDFDGPVILLGDLMEAIGPKDRRYSVDEHAGKTIMQSLHQLEYDLDNAKADVWILMKGNHEDTIFRSFGNMYKDTIVVEDDNKELVKEAGLCEKVGADYGGMLCFLVLKNGKHRSYWQLAHPYKGGVNYKAGHPKRKRTNAEIKIEWMQEHVSEADLYAVAHIHQLIVSEPDYVNKLIFDEKQKKLIMGRSYRPFGKMWHCATGCFKKVYKEGEDDYAEHIMVSPSDIGWIEVDIDRELNIIDVRKVFAHTVQGPGKKKSVSP